MSASMDSLPARDAWATPTSALRVMWGRLLWKDAREVAPIWLTLLMAAILCLSMTAWMVNKEYAHIAPLYISGHTFIALCSVITGVFLFASEDENRTLHLLRNLPLPPQQIVWQKVILGAVGVVALACVIAGITALLARFVQSGPLETNSSFGFSVANVSMLPLLYLVISSFSSMVTRSHFYGVLIAGVVCVSVIAVLEPTWLGARQSNYTERSALRWIWVGLSILTGTAALVLRAKDWVEERVITGASLMIDDAQSNDVAAGLRPEVTNPFPILLWQSYRQSRVILACWLGMTVIGWIVMRPLIEYSIDHPKHSVPEIALLTSFWSLLWMFGTTIVFASSIFLNDKHRGNYLFFQQNRERSKWFWLSRVLPFVGVALLMVLLWSFFIFDVSSSHSAQNFDTYYDHVNVREIEFASSFIVQVASQAVLVPFLVLLGTIGLGQCFSMFVRNPVLAFVFTCVVSVVFILIVAYVVFVNESIFLFLMPWIASVYLATWWRSKSWLATTPSVSHFLRPAVMPLIVFAITAAFFIHHRVTEFGDVEIDANNYAEHLNVNLLGNSGTKLGWQRIEFGTEAQRQQAAKLYREAIELAEINQADAQSFISVSWPKSEISKFVSARAESFAKIVEAAEIPTCAPFFSLEATKRREEEMTLKQVALLSSHYLLLEGDLRRAKKGIDAHDRLWQRSSYDLSSPRMKSGYYSLLIAWADHPEQKLAAVKSAIMQLEGNASRGVIKMVDARGKSIDVDSSFAFQIEVLFREFGGEQAFQKMQQEIADLQLDNENHPLAAIRTDFRLMPWEYERLTKVGQLRLLQQYQIAQRNIALEAISNDLAFGRDLNFYSTYPTSWQNDGPYIPVDEDRWGFGDQYYNNWGSYWSMRQVANKVTWRRYALLRLGLAAYKIEHGSYPDELTQLASYYQNELPQTTDGMMFAWFKNGPGSDLIRATYENGDSGNLESAEVLADGNKPLLLPFALAPSKPLPDPFSYGQGKMGIAIDIATDILSGDHQMLVPNWDEFSCYPMKWTVGER